VQEYELPEINTGLNILTNKHIGAEGD